MSVRRASAAIALLACMSGAAAAADAFKVAVEAGGETNGRSAVKVSFGIPPGHYLYDKQLRVEAAAPAVLEKVDAPAPHSKTDPFSGEPVDVHDTDSAFRYSLLWGDATSAWLTVRYQGCSPEICFLPASRSYTVGRDGSVLEGGGSAPPAAEPPAAEAAGWRELVSRFAVTSSYGGYLKEAEFIAFVDGGEAPGGGLEGRGLAASALLILLWGLALNLTPCVLPMIPINLAIIGAGARAGSRSRGFALGALYGAGMAAAYGLLGVIVVLTGTVFGALNASPWFNLALAALFVGLALAMFDVFAIDFSRFQGRFGGAAMSGAARWVAAPLMGALAAVLAGACVAPAVIIVLTLAADLYGRGIAAGLLLPFLLGVGMALPWPFAGAGLSFLPKPGRWMDFVKYAFGAIVLGIAAFYGHSAYEGFAWRSAERRASVARAQEEQVKEGGWLTSLPDALRAALSEGKPVFVDFWATWCKNCLAMDATTFRAPAVRKRLEGFVRVKVQAEDPSDPAMAELLKRFGVRGLPTYLVLRPLDEALPKEGPP